MTSPGGDDRPFDSTDERDRDRPVTMRSMERTEEEPDNWDDDDREQWLRENVPPHHI
jgi:hypothetical protein